MDRSWDIFHLDGERGLRGGERQLLYLAAALRARGHRNTVVCRRASPLETEARRQGFQTENLPYLCEWDPISAWKLARLARRSRRPVLHAHTAHTAALAAFASPLGGLPWVAHRRVDFELSGRLSRRLKYDRAGRVVAVSGAIARLLERSGVPPARIAVVPDGLPVGDRERQWTGAGEEVFSPASAQEKAHLRWQLAQRFGARESDAWVGNLAALVPHKDHDTLIAAALLVIQKRPETTFLIAGQGPEQERLLKQIKLMGLMGKILILGQLGDPAALLRSLDLFVLSSWGEGMGSVLLEAAACGVPIAATTAGGIPEIVTDGSSGLLVPPRDPESLAGAIDRLLADRELAQRLADRARAGLRDFGLERMAVEMEAVYAALA
ncbi:MAG: glycosyltransferase [Elusimicrobia bacterium]|nr:glycosyltransferase [Elusimicrobiota bacterium]